MFISRTLFYFAANLIALLALDYFIEGFDLIAQPVNLVVVTLIFTALNTYIRPIVKHVLTTFIIISFGLFSLVINAGVLLMLDFISENITINGLLPLLYSTLIITLANIITGLFNRLFFKRNV